MTFMIAPPPATGRFRNVPLRGAEWKEGNGPTALAYIYEHVHRM